MENKAFSIIIPTCDRPIHLEKCLFSLSIQRYPKDKIETIIVDDGHMQKAKKFAKKL